MSFDRQDRRKFGRRETNWAGRIITDNGRTIRCIVKDCSVAGALIELLEPTYLPFHFTLEVEVSGFRGRCEVRHHRDCRVGIEFVRVEAASRPEQQCNPVADGQDLTPPPSVRAPMRCNELRALVRRH